LDAFVPEHGENLARSVPQVVDDWKVPPISAERFNVNSADREWVDRQCTIQPIDCWRQPITLTNGIDQIKNITYILAKGWGGEHAPFTPYYEKAQAKGWKALTIACGHDVMLDRPEELARMLLDTLEIPSSHA
jgi:hypothetical protein